MKNLKLLSKTFFFILLFVSASLQAETKWDVTAVFLGADERQGQENFQADIDQNILELARIQNLKSINLNIYREMPLTSYTFSPVGKKEIELQSLLHEIKTGKIKINGDFQSTSRKELTLFLNKSFKDLTSKKILIVYGHGVGPEGLLDMPVSELKTILAGLKNKPDIIWFDSCFQASTEFLYELKNYSRYSIASQEAEFSSGLPFQVLDQLPQINNSRTASLLLAKNFIESYSYIKNGSQRHNVLTSSATIAVIDNQRLENLVAGIKTASHFVKSLPAEDRKKVAKRLTEKFAMDERLLSDLGHTLIELRLVNNNKNIDQVLTAVIRELNIESVAKLKTNPRVQLISPATNAVLVYGFNDWKMGSKESSPFLPTESFTVGPQGKFWPVFKTNATKIFVTPFSPGVSTFNYYWIDAQTKKRLTADVAIKRTTDVIEKNSDSSVLVYNAYTQAEGTKAERYTGLNISHFDSVPSMDLFEMELIQKTGWLSL